MKIVFVASKFASIYEIEIRRYASKDDEIIINQADAIDFISAERLRSNGYKIIVYSPDYERYGKSAPLIRDKLIVDHADLVIAVWDGDSSGTEFTISYAKRRGVPCEVYIL
jgi:hypothetical protein